MSNLDLSLKMQVYNDAKAWARRTGLTDEARVNRALGILQKTDALGRALFEYGTTIKECYCMDSQSPHDLVCKHRLAVMMWTRIQERKGDFLGMELPTEFELDTALTADVLDPNDAPEMLKMWTSY